MVRYRNQNIIYKQLIDVFGEAHVHKEWDVVKGSQDGYTRALYCPRIDFAVDPFNIDRNLDENNRRISEKYFEYEPLFSILIQHSNIPENNLELNNNPRCFLTIEHENNVTRKHMIGTIINASAIGKVGIAIAAQNKTYRALSRIKKYLDALVEFDKLDFFPKNVIIVNLNEFINCLQEYVVNYNNNYFRERD